MRFPGESKRTYSSTLPVLLSSGWNNWTPFGVADWDGDGHKDIVARNNDTGDLILFGGQSRRTLPGTWYRIGNGYNGYGPFGIADWDFDGHQDLLTRLDSNGILWLFPGESKRGYTNTPRVQIGNGW